MARGHSPPAFAQKVPQQGQQNTASLLSDFRNSPKQLSAKERTPKRFSYQVS